MLDLLAKGLAGRLLPGLDGLGGDALEGAVIDMLSSRIGPHLMSAIAEVRSRLIATVTPAPPATLRAELEQLGLRPDDAQLQVLWAAIFRAIAAQPKTEPPQLTVVAGGATS